MSKPQVLIADDHRILAEGVRGLLEPEFEVVGVVDDGRELVVAAKKLQPDVIVADISMPSLNGIEAAVQLRDSGVTSRVVFLTQHREVAYARRAIDAGASGYVLKHSVATELVTAIHEALRGQTYITPMIAGELLDSYRTRRFGRRRCDASVNSAATRSSAIDCRRTFRKTDRFTSQDFNSNRRSTQSKYPEGPGTGEHRRVGSVCHSQRHYFCLVRVAPTGSGRSKSYFAAKSCWCPGFRLNWRTLRQRRAAKACTPT